MPIKRQSDCPGKACMELKQLVGSKGLSMTGDGILQATQDNRSLRTRAFSALNSTLKATEKKNTRTKTTTNTCRKT